MTVSVMGAYCASKRHGTLARRDDLIRRATLGQHDLMARGVEDGQLELDARMVTVGDDDAAHAGLPCCGVGSMTALTTLRSSTAWNAADQSVSGK